MNNCACANCDESLLTLILHCKIQSTLTAYCAYASNLTFYALFGYIHKATAIEFIVSRYPPAYSRLEVQYFHYS